VDVLVKFAVSSKPGRDGNFYPRVFDVQKTRVSDPDPLREPSTDLPPTEFIRELSVSVPLNLFLWIGGVENPYMASFTFSDYTVCSRDGTLSWRAVSTHILKKYNDRSKEGGKEEKTFTYVISSTNTFPPTATIHGEFLSPQEDG
jgi:hypothetical protein